MAAVLAELIKSLLNGDDEYPEESSIIARAVQLGISSDKLDIIAPLVIKTDDRGQTYSCEEVNGKRVFSKVEQLLLDEDKMEALLYLHNIRAISGAELDAILVFAHSIAKDPTEPDYLKKALTLVLQDKDRANFLTGAIYRKDELLN